MTVETGVSKLVAFKKETTFNSITTGGSVTSANYLRRVSSDIDLSKDVYESQEIRSDYQVADARHGMRKVGGTIKGELSPGAYSKFIQSALRKDFIAGPTDTNMAITLAGSGPTYTITRPAGALAKLWKAGMVTAITTQTGGVAGNLNKNLFIVDVTDTVLTVIPGGDGTLDISTPTATAVTLAIPTISAVAGKVTYVPETGHTNDSYAIEHYYSTLTKSELFSGCKVNSIDIGLPATGIATCDINVLGAGFNAGTNGTWAGTAQYFSSPTAAPTFGLLTAVNGVLRIGGSTIAVVTGLTIKIEGGMTTGAVVGSNVTPDVFPGRVRVSGQLTAYFDSVTIRDYFVNETSFELLAVLYSDNTAGSNYMSFAMPNCKAMGATKSDGEQGLTMTIPFVALFNGSPASNTVADSYRTTLMIQDSQAT